MKKIKILIKTIGYSFRLLYRSSRLMILVYLGLKFMCVTIPLFLTFVFKYFLDALVAKVPDVTVVVFWAILYIIAIVVLQCMNSVMSILYASIFQKAEHQYDCDLFEKLGKIPMSIIDTSEGKNMIDDVRNNKYNAVYFIDRNINILSFIYTFCVTFSTLIKFNIWFSFAFLLLTIPGVFMDAFFRRKSDGLRQKTAPDVRRFSYYRWMLTDVWPAKDVRMYNLTDPIKERYDYEKDEYRRKFKKLDQKSVIVSVFIEIIMRSGELAFTIFVLLKALAGEIGVGDVALYIGFATTASSNFRATVSLLVMNHTWTSDLMERFFEFNSINCFDKHKGKRKLVQFESLVFDNVFFKYPLTNKYVLSGASFTLKRGDKLSIVGINGSGKSTIIKLMLGLYEIESGQILLNGYPMSDYDIKDIRKLYSVLFQNFVQYPLTLRDNIALSDYYRAMSDEDIICALKQSGVYDELKMNLENGLDSYMTRQFDDEGIELSKGQWQKIALSRAYFKNASIIIFDEPSASLDAEAEDRIFQNFRDVLDNRTGIMISHRISASQMSNKIIVLDNGKIVENGTHDELIALNGLYAKFYNLQKYKYTIKEDE